MKIIGVTDLQRGFRKVIDEVAEERVPYVLTRGSRPEAVLVPYDEYQRLQKLQEKEVVLELDRLLARNTVRTEGVSEDEMLRDVRAARDEARPTRDLLDRAKRRLDSLSRERLRAAEDFLAYLEERETDEATDEILRLPGLVAALERAEREVAEGPLTPVERRPVPVAAAPQADAALLEAVARWEKLPHNRDGADKTWVEDLLHNTRTHLDRARRIDG